MFFCLRMAFGMLFPLIRQGLCEKKNRILFHKKRKTFPKSTEAKKSASSVQLVSFVYNLFQVLVLVLGSFHTSGRWPR